MPTGRGDLNRVDARKEFLERAFHRTTDRRQQDARDGANGTLPGAIEGEGRRPENQQRDDLGLRRAGIERITARQREHRYVVVATDVHPHGNRAAARYAHGVRGADVEGRRNCAASEEPHATRIDREAATHHAQVEAILATVRIDLTFERKAISAHGDRETTGHLHPRLRCLHPDFVTQIHAGVLDVQKRAECRQRLRGGFRHGYFLRAKQFPRSHRRKIKRVARTEGIEHEVGARHEQGAAERGALERADHRDVAAEVEIRAVALP